MGDTAQDVLFEIKTPVRRKDVEEWNRYQREFTGVNLTPEQMIEVMKEDVGGSALMAQALWLEFATEEREMFMDMLCRHLINEDWPMNMDAQDPTFEDRFFAAAKEKGYEVFNEEGWSDEGEEK